MHSLTPSSALRSSRLTCLFRIVMGLALLLIPSLNLFASIIRVPQDQKTIQAGIDIALPGDLVIVSPGTYRERLRLNPGVIVQSAGDDSLGKFGLLRAEKTTIDGAFQDAEGPGVTMAEGSTIDGFSVTGVGIYDDEEWKKHYATRGSEQGYEEIGTPGIAGISVVGISDCSVKNNIVHHIGYSGIAVMGQTGMRVSPHIYRNVTYRNMGGGIGSMKKSTARIEENRCFENFYAGIGHDDASPLVINNICYHNIRAGIGISEGAQPFVRGNKCYENRRAGIGVRTGEETRPIIEKNECYDNDMAGIGASDESSPLIRSNRCYRNQMVGIGADTHATPTIIGNECFENRLVGIGQQNGAQTILIGNHCHHNLVGGIGLEATDSGTAKLLQNRVSENGKIAVGINAGWTVFLSGNTLTNKEGLPPVVMVHKGAKASFFDNVIKGGGVAGIRVAGHAYIHDNTFQGTSLRKVGPPNYGVWALPGSKVTLSENQFDMWRHALLATESTVTANGNKVSNFHQTAIVVQKPIVPPNLFGNRAKSDQPNSNVVVFDGEPGIVEDNQIERNEE